jgi:beta-aspartyl-peptidase (threonine type)
MNAQPVLLIHGGAWAMPDDAVAAHEDGIANALAAGYALLEQGASSVDAVEAAVAVMEDDETFDAGRGSFLTQDGRVQMDALLMNGENLRTGGVACVERIRNPIHAARLVLDKSPHVYFVGTGAERFARQHGMALCDNMELVIPREQERLYKAQAAERAGLPDETFSGGPDSRSLDSGSRLDSHDTVGAVALDRHGNIAAGTSTGGTLNKAPGRVGDSSLIGCGCYADNHTAAVSLTGWGEPIMKLVLGKWAVDRVAAGASPDEAAHEAIDYLFNRLGGHGGIILLDADGRVGLAHNTPRMAWGLRTVAGVQVGVTRNRASGTELRVTAG